MIYALAKPLVHPEGMLPILLPEVWKIGGEGALARAFAHILNDDQLVSYLEQLERLFFELWDRQRNASSEELYDDLYLNAGQLGLRIAERIESLRIQTSITAQGWLKGLRVWPA